LNSFVVGFYISTLALEGAPYNSEQNIVILTRAIQFLCDSGGNFSGYGSLLPPQRMNSCCDTHLRADLRAYRGIGLIVYPTRRKTSYLGLRIKLSTTDKLRGFKARRSRHFKR